MGRVAQYVFVSWMSAGTLSYAAEFPLPTNPKVVNLYKAARKLQPTISRQFALDLATHLNRHATAQGTDPYLSLAIAMQESGLRQINRVDKGKVTDYGIFQFHYRTAQWMQLDTKRLETDLEYAVRKHVKLLKLKQQQCKSWGPHSWLCYHSATTKHAQKYKQLVDRYYFLVNPRPE